LNALVMILIFLSVTKSFALTPLTVAFSLDKPPYVVRATESGIEVEIIRRILLDMGYELVPTFQPPARSVKSLEQGRVDAMATIKNAPNFYLSNPYIIFRNYAWSLRSKKLQIHTLSDLSKYRVIAFQNARSFLGSEYEKAIEKNSNYQEVADQSQQIRMLLTDRTDVVVCEERTLKNNQKKIEPSLKTMLPEIEKHSLFEESKYSVAFRNVKLRDSFNEVLKKLESHKAFDKIYEKYGSE